MAKEEEYNAFVLRLKPWVKDGIVPFFNKNLQVVLSMVQQIKQLQRPRESTRVNAYNQPQMSQNQNRNQRPPPNMINVVKLEPNTTTFAKQTQTCFYCKKPRHLAADCKKQKADNQKQGNRREAQ